MSETTTAEADQGTLFGADGAPPPPEPASVAHARRTDPSTSHAAAASIGEDALRPRQRAVLSLLREDAADHARLIERYARMHATDPDRFPRQSESGIRTRVAELVDVELVRDSGARVVLASGRQSIVWEATP